MTATTTVVVAVLAVVVVVQSVGADDQLAIPVPFDGRCRIPVG